MTQSKSDTRDFPFDEVIKKASELIKTQGAIIYQKFSCAKCGTRQTIDVPNVFYTQGQCEECGHISNLKAQGCNYLLMLGPVPPTLEEQKAEIARNKSELERKRKEFENDEVRNTSRKDETL